MNIGLVSTWFERGAAYVTKAYIEALKDKHSIYVYARGGESYAKNDPNWDFDYVTWGLKLHGTNINFIHFKKWILKNDIQIIFFNEQHEIEIIVQIKKTFPYIKIGSYIDYYKENTVKDFELFDFLICNTKRHYSIFKDHPQCYYIPWGTDIELFKPTRLCRHNLAFFHSVGMSTRKGTDLLLRAFIDGKLYTESELIIHSQLKFDEYFAYSKDELKKYNIQVIVNTVPAPGLYFKGDIYVYPTTLEGLGLTLYEALSCGLPVITTDEPPMNEIVTSKVGYLVNVETHHSRSDGYLWPLSYCSKESLIKGMRYYINNKKSIASFKKIARIYAVTKLDWRTRHKDVCNIFEDSKILDNNKIYIHYIKNKRKEKVNRLKTLIIYFLPDVFVHTANRIKEIILNIKYLYLKA